MRTTLLVIVILVAAAGSIPVRGGDDSPPAADPRIDKLILQTEQILKNQEEINQKLDKLSQDLLQLRRRSN